MVKAFDTLSQVDIKEWASLSWDLDKCTVQLGKVHFRNRSTFSFERRCLHWKLLLSAHIWEQKVYF